MQLHVLGSAAGGGVPQWNCACGNCAAARAHRLPQRTQASSAASADGVSWVLFNATTDLRAQLARDPALAPAIGRDTPIRAVCLTDANVDHCAGLLDLRQAGTLAVYSTRTVRDVLLRNEIFAPFARAPRTWSVVGTAPVEVCGLRIAAIPVPGLLPSYAGGGAEVGAACAYVIEDGDGAKALYAPVFAALEPALLAVAADADLAFFDGSFWSEDELASLGLGERTAAQMGHQPVGGAGGSLEVVRALPSLRRFYTHVNNTNPMLDPSSEAARLVKAAGVEIASDGATFELGRHARRTSARA